MQKIEKQRLNKRYSLLSNGWIKDEKLSAFLIPFSFSSANAPSFRKASELAKKAGGRLMTTEEHFSFIRSIVFRSGVAKKRMS